MWKEGWLQHTRKQKIRGVFIQRSMFLCKLRCAIKRRYGVMRAIARFVCQSLTLKCSLNKKSNNFNVSNAEKKVSANRAPQHKRGAWFIALVLFYRMRRLWNTVNISKKKTFWQFENTGWAKNNVPKIEFKSLSFSLFAQFSSSLCTKFLSIKICLLIQKKILIQRQTR